MVAENANAINITELLNVMEVKENQAEVSNA